MKNLLLIALLMTTAIFFSSCKKDDVDDPDTPLDCTSTTSVFAINLDATACDVDIEATLGVSSNYTETINNNTRTVTINNIASHNVGQFPNSGNPNTISEAIETFSMTTNPSLASSSTSGQGYTTGVFFSGVSSDPYTAEFFIGTSGANMAWNITALQSTTPLGLDCNNAHVQPTGKYHYHGSQSAYIEDLGGANGDAMLKIGYAADGFPIYYKYGYAADGVTIVEYTSGYQLKTVERGGDGSSAPDGCPDGYYFADYEFVDSASDLDACNGIMGKTPESDNEYYYVITDNFPSLPLCFSGTPDDSFHH